MICENIAQGFGDSKRYEIEVNRKKAITKAIKSLSGYKNPVLLVLGKGDEQTQTIYDHRLPFCDATVIKEVLDEKDF